MVIKSFISIRSAMLGIGLILLSWTSPERIVNKEINTADYLTEREKDMIRTINFIRMRPAEYLTEVQESYDRVLADSVALKGRFSEIISTAWEINDGDTIISTDTIYRERFTQLKTAYESLILELQQQQPLPSLVPHPDLFTAARKHAIDQIPSNYLQHYGTDGRWPEQRIKESAPWAYSCNENIAAGPKRSRQVLLQLMVDSGVDTRGHRKNLLNPDWAYVVCHEVLEISDSEFSWWIQEFAN